MCTYTKWMNIILLLMVSDRNDIIPVECFCASNKFRHFVESYYKFHPTNE